MLIVYEDFNALEEAEEKPIEGYPSYYHSGVLPPLRRVVERRFAAREHTPVPPPRAAVADVEYELMQLMEKIAKDEKSKRNKVPTLTSANKVLEEVIEEEVDYEPWMDDHGRQPHGIEFEADDRVASAHPEIWLSPEAIAELKEEDLEVKRKQKEAAEKKEKRKEKKAAAAAAAAAVELAKPTKKGIPSKKNTPQVVVDEVTQAAASMLDDVDLMGSVLDGDDLFDLDLNDDDLDLGIDLT